MSEPKQIYELIPKVVADIGAIGKDSKNQHFGFNYRSIDAVYQALHKAVVKHSVTIIPEVVDVEREGNSVRLLVKYTLFAPDGSSVSSVVASEAQDKADKATSKAMSMAFKYWAFQAFCIPIEGSDDADSGAGTAPSNEQPPARAPFKPREVKRDMGEELKSLLGSKWIGIAQDFFTSKGKLKTGQDLKFLGDKEASWAVNHCDKFIAVLEEFALEQGDVPT